MENRCLPQCECHQHLKYQIICSRLDQNPVQISIYKLFNKKLAYDGPFLRIQTDQMQPQLDQTFRQTLDSVSELPFQSQSDEDTYKETSTEVSQFLIIVLKPELLPMLQFVSA